jgi:hypothetical protein
MVSCTCVLLPNPAKVSNSNIRHDGTLSIGNFMLMMKKPKNLEFEPQHPKNVLLASVVRGISCLLGLKRPFHISYVESNNGIY